MEVVIVGGGFAGIKTARMLGRDNRFKITLISNRSNFEYHAALYRSATGRSPLEVVVPLKDIFVGYSNVAVVKDSVTAIDKVSKQVNCMSGQAVKYDELILAPGVVDNFFGIKGLKENTYGIKSIDEAMRLKKHLHKELTAPASPDRNYVVIGAGPTGVELAGELVSYLAVLRKRHGVATKFKVSLIEAAPRILPALPVAFSRRIETRLKKLGIKVYTSTAVKGATAANLQLPEGNIKTHTIIWTAGSANSPIFENSQPVFQFDKTGKVINKNLQAIDHIWVAGDSAATPKSGLASTAVYDGEYISKCLKAKIMKQAAPEYSPPEAINAIPVGPGWCAVHYKSRNIFGASGWAVRRWTDLQLYRAILPQKVAIKSWLMGNRFNEECPICRKSIS